MPAPAFRAASSGTGALPSFVVSKPTGTVDGDLLLVVLSMYMADNTKDVNSVPAGWTLLRTLNNFALSNHRASVYWKVASGEPSTWTFGTNATVAHGQAWAAVAISDPVASPAYISDSSGQIDATATVTHTAPSVNAGSATDLLAYVGCGRSSSFATGWTPPSGYTERVDVYESANANNSITVATKAAAGASGATGTVSGSTAPNADDASSFLVAINGGPGASTSGTAAKVKYGNALKVTDEGSSVIRVDAQGMPVGGALGQVLTKKTATDYDTQWQAAAAAVGTVAEISNVVAYSTGVTPTGDGDLLYTFPAATFTAVKHYWELAALLASAAGNETLFFRLHDTGSPGALIWEAVTRTPAANPGSPVLVRVPFTPTAGSHTFTIRWRSSSAAAAYTLANNSIPFSSRICIA